MADVKELFSMYAPDVSADLQPFIELIQEIMAMPEEGLNEGTVNALKNLILTNFPKDQRAATVNAVLKNFEASNTAPQELINGVQKVKETLQAIVEELKPSMYKRELIEGVFGIFYEIFDEVIERYHSITIPMKLEEGAKIPTYAHDTDACADLYASQDMTLPAHSFSNLVHTGVRIALPSDWVTLLDTRSSIGMKKKFVTRIDETAILFDKIAFSGGKIGVQVEMDPLVLCDFIEAKFVDLTKN